MFSNNGLSASDVALLSGNSRNNDDGNAWGGDGAWLIIILFLFVFCGWGNGGFGGWGGNNGGGTANTPGFQGYATRADINEGFMMNDIQSGIRGIQNGICDSTYAVTNAVTNGFSNNQLQLCNGFNGVQTQMANLSAQQQSCCCETQRAIERGFADTNYNMATQACDTRQTIQNTTRDILENNNANTRAVLDFLTNSKIDDLQTQLSQAQTQLSQAQQTNNIVAALRPTPVPSFPASNLYGYYNCGCNTCGC